MRDYSKLSPENITWKSNDEIIEFDNKYKAYILSVFMKKNVDTDSSQILYNDILIKFSQGKLNYDPRLGKYETFLYRVAENMALDFFREMSRNNERTTEITEQNTSTLFDLSLGNKIEMEFFRIIAIEAMKRLCKSCKTKQKNVEIFTKRCFANESIQQLSDEYDKTKSEISLTVSRLHAKYKKFFLEVRQEIESEQLNPSNISIDFLSPIMNSTLLVA